MRGQEGTFAITPIILQFVSCDNGERDGSYEEGIGCDLIDDEGNQQTKLPYMSCDPVSALELSR